MKLYVYCLAERLDRLHQTLRGVSDAEIRIVDQIEETLKSQTDDARRLRILKVETTEHGELKAKFAFLVKRAAFEEFRDAAERLAQEHQSAGVRLELTGPWPVYNFCAG